jgi:hypothetical protein
MYESLCGFKDVHEFSAHLKRLASDHHGKAGRTFIREVMAKRAQDAQALLSFLDAREAGYKQKSEVKIVSSENLPRLRDKFATVYAAGCLAIREKILPYKAKDLLEAILICEQDHIDFVEKELAKGAQRRSPFEELHSYITTNRGRFVNLRKDPLPVGYKHETCCGYITEHNGSPEYLFPESTFLKIAGDEMRAKELKNDLRGKKLIATAAAGVGSIRYAVRRPIGGKREYVVAISAVICGGD